MKKLKLFFACLLMAVLSIGQVWAENVNVSFASWETGVSAYSATEWTDNGCTFTYANNNNKGWAYVRCGGKGATASSTIQYNSQVGISVESVVLNTSQGIANGSSSSITITGVEVAAYSDDEFTTLVSSKDLGTLEYTKSNCPTSITVTPTTAWAKDLYYKITISWTATGSKNCGLNVSGITFNEYEETPSPSVSVDPASWNFGTVHASDAASKVFSVSGSNLEAGTLTLTVPTGFSVSPSSIAVDGTLAATEVTVSKNTSAENDYDGNLEITGGGLASAKTVALTMTVDADPAPTGTFEPFSENIEEGDYLIVADGAGMNTTVSGSRLQYLALTLTGENYVNPDVSVIWHIAASATEGYWTIYNEDDGNYAAATGSNNQAQMLASGTDDKSLWTITHSGAAYTIQNKSNSRYLKKNGTYGFACYGDGTVSLYKLSNGKEAAGLAFDAADAQKLVKVGGTLTAPTLTNPNTLAVTYASGNTDVVEVDASGAITAIKAAGTAVITASTEGDATHNPGSASYTIFVAEQAGTEADPLTEASAKSLIDDGCTLTVHVNGLVLSQNSTNFTVTLTNGFQFYKAKDLNNVAFESAYLAAGDEVTAVGALKKFSSTYELDEGCYLTFYEQATTPLTPIANDQDHPYTVAQALVYAAAPTTYDLSDVVYVRGKVAIASTSLFSSKYLTYSISDDGTTTDVLKVYNGLGIGGADFTSKDDILVGDVVVVKGNLTQYNTELELAANNELVSKKPVATIAIENMELEYEEVATISATITPAAAASTVVYSIKAGSDDVITLVGDEITAKSATGTATIVATIASTDDYEGVSIEFTVSVAEPAPVLTDYYEKVTSGSVAEGTYLIVYEAGSLAFNGGLETLDAVGNSIAVDIVSGNKIGVTAETEAATVYIDPTEGTIKAANGNFIGVGSWNNGLQQNSTYVHNVLEIDGDGNAQVGIYNADWNTTGGTMRLQYNKTSGQTRFRYFKNGGQQPIALYKLANEVIKPASGLAWDPAEDIEITVGDAFTAPTLLNPNSIPAGDITIESSNTDLAIISEGVPELVENATGTTTITATYTGEIYKPTTVSYKIKVNPAASIYVSPSLNVNFGSVVKDAALPADKTITVTLNNVAAATATLGGTNPEAFSIDPATLTESGDITISVIASTAAAATYSATITITDDANMAAEKVVNLSFAVTEPAAEETPVSTTSKWVPATAADLVDGKVVLITGTKETAVYAMGEQKTNNRAAVLATVDGEGVLTPGEGTRAFTLVAQDDNKFALRTADGKYLYAASSSANQLKKRDAIGDDNNANWTVAVDALTANGSNRGVMQFNYSTTNQLFSCYASASSSYIAIALYVEQSPEPPTPGTEVRTGLTAGNYYTICYPQTMTSVTGATLWSFVGKEEGLAYIQQESAPFAAGKPYLMYATAATVQAVLEGDAVTTAGSNGALHGTFENLVQEQLDGFGSDVYLVIGNELRRATGAGTGSNTLPANRAYVKLSDIPEGAPAHAPGKNIRTMPMHKDATTGIDDLNASDAPRKVMIDCALFILRGEKLYDATGRLVK